jgi:hypothetical protein
VRRGGGHNTQDGGVFFWDEVEDDELVKSLLRGYKVNTHGGLLFGEGVSNV